MSEFDDDQLRRAVGRRAGGDVPVAAAHDAVLARAGHIRRRRAAIAGTGGLVALVVGGLVLLPRGVDDSQAPANTGDPIPTVDDSTTTTTTVEVSVLPVVTVAATDPSVATPSVLPTSTIATTVVTTAVAPRPTTTHRTAPSTTKVETSVATTSVGTTATTAGSTTAPTTSSSSSSSSTTPPTLAPFTRTYDSAGGSIRVNWDGDAFTLLSVAPTPGFESEIEDQQATRIRVRFSGEPDDSRIELRVDDGQLSVIIS